MDLDQILQLLKQLLNLVGSDDIDKLLKVLNQEMLYQELLNQLLKQLKEQML